MEFNMIQNLEAAVRSYAVFGKGFSGNLVKSLSKTKKATGELFFSVSKGAGYWQKHIFFKGSGGYRKI